MKPERESEIEALKSMCDALLNRREEFILGMVKRLKDPLNENYKMVSCSINNLINIASWERFPLEDFSLRPESYKEFSELCSVQEKRILATIFLILEEVLFTARMVIFRQNDLITLEELRKKTKEYSLLISKFNKQNIGMFSDGLEVENLTLKYLNNIDSILKLTTLDEKTQNIEDFIFFPFAGESRKNKDIAIVYKTFYNYIHNYFAFIGITDKKIERILFNMIMDTEKDDSTLSRYLK